MPVARGIPGSSDQRLPDLLFTGEDSPLHRRLYIIYRMLSEAITLRGSEAVLIADCGESQAPNSNRSERDIVEASFLRCFVKVAKKHLWSLYHQMFIVLIAFVILLPH